MAPQSVQQHHVGSLGITPVQVVKGQLTGPKVAFCECLLTHDSPLSGVSKINVKIWVNSFYLLPS